MALKKLPDVDFTKVVKSLRMPKQSTLKNLIQECLTVKNRYDKANGTLREHIGDAVENENLHKGGFALYRKFAVMADRKGLEETRDLRDNFLALMEHSGLNARLNKVQRLPLEDEDEQVAGAPAENVSNIEDYQQQAAAE